MDEVIDPAVTRLRLIRSFEMLANKRQSLSRIHISREVCKRPREAQHFAWLRLDSEEGQEYWMSMNLAGDYALSLIHI